MAESATKVAPHSAQGLVLMGRVQAAKGCPQDARQWFEKAVRSDPKCAQASIALANIHRTVRCSLSYWLSCCAEVLTCVPQPAKCPLTPNPFQCTSQLPDQIHS